MQPMCLMFWKPKPALLLCAGMLLAACGRPAAPPAAMQDIRSEADPVQESWGAAYYITETTPGDAASRPRLTMRAGHMATFEAGDSAWTVLRSASSGGRVTALLYDEAGDSSATILADRITLLDNKRRFEATGNVEVRARGDKALWSEHLVWSEREQILRTPGFVRIATPDEQVQGYALEADERLDEYALRSMTGRVTVREE